jgi:hypothetical protein
MIFCLITREHAYTVQEFLQTWGRRLALRFRFLYYDELVRWHALPVGTYLFTDLERLSPAQMRLARLLAERLEASPDPARRIVNDPRRVLLRYDLLRRLHEKGVNPFRPWRIDELSAGEPCFPVFLRREDDHSGNLSPLVEVRPALDQAIAAALRSGAARENLLAVEFFDTRDEHGAYWKYAAFRIGEAVFPHHLIRREQWLAKDPSDLSADRFDRENAFVTRRPHDAKLMEIFELAGIDYGRIDYSTTDGRPGSPLVVWEINTNPSVLLAPDLVADERLLARAQVARWLLRGFESLDLSPLYAKPASHIELGAPNELARELGYGSVHRARDAALRGLRRAGRFPILRPLARRVGQVLPRGPQQGRA